MTQAEWKVYEISICSLKAPISKENVLEHISPEHMLFLKVILHSHSL